MVHFKRQHLLCVFEHPPLVGRILRAVDEFAGIFAQVEKQRRQRTEMYILELVIAQYRQVALV